MHITTKIVLSKIVHPTLCFFITYAKSYFCVFY